MLKRNDGPTEAERVERRFLGEIDRTAREHERTMAAVIGAHEKAIASLSEQFDRERATLLEQIKLLKDILQPAYEPDTQTFPPSEEAEHMAYAASSGQLDPAYAGILSEIGLDPNMTIEPATD